MCAMATRSHVSAKVFLLGCAIAVALFALIMIIAGIRIDRGIPQPPPADSAEISRQDTVETLLQLADGAESLSAGEDQYAALAATARFYADELGGLWVPWPDGAPEGATNPPVETAAPRDLSAEGMTLLYDAAIEDLVAALAAAPESQATLYATLVADLASLAPPEAAALPGEVPGADELAEVATDAQTVRVLDVARQYLETATARTPEDQRERLQARVDRLDAIVDAMLEAGAADTRVGVADLPDWFYDDPSQLDRLVGEANALVADQAMFLTNQVPAERRIDLVQLALEFGWTRKP